MSGGCEGGKLGGKGGLGVGEGGGSVAGRGGGEGILDGTGTSHMHSGTGSVPGNFVRKLDRKLSGKHV